MKSKNWLQRHKKDMYVKKAKKEDYLSRSAFKLIEIEKKFKIIFCKIFYRTPNYMCTQWMSHHTDLCIWTFTF